MLVDGTPLHTYRILSSSSCCRHFKTVIPSPAKIRNMKRRQEEEAERKANEREIEGKEEDGVDDGGKGIRVLESLHEEYQMRTSSSRTKMTMMKLRMMYLRKATLPHVACRLIYTLTVL